MREQTNELFCLLESNIEVLYSYVSASSIKVGGGTRVGEW